MSASNIGDLRINGSGSSGGGVFDRVRINGSGRINGDVECQDFTISGTGEVSGKVAAGKMSVNGMGKFTGDAKADDIKINGSASFDGNVFGEDAYVSGTANIAGGLSGGTIKIDGSVNVKDDCSADKFRSNGVFVIGGLLNADEIDIRLNWHKSSAREIGGSKIEVRLGGGMAPRRLKTLMVGHDPALDAELIEGDEIYLENTKAKVVRGSKVTIGQGCDIGTVEYKEFCRKEENTKVGREQKI